MNCHHPNPYGLYNNSNSKIRPNIDKQEKLLLIEKSTFKEPADSASSETLSLMGGVFCLFVCSIRGKRGLPELPQALILFIRVKLSPQDEKTFKGSNSSELIH